MKVDRFFTRNTMVDVNCIYFWSSMVEFLEIVKNPRTEISNWNDVWLMIFQIVWGLRIVIGAENKWPRVFSFKCKESWDWVSNSYLFKLRSKMVLECFQNWFCDCYSIIGLCGRCEDGLLASNHLGSCYPSPPAQSKNGASISGLELLQMLAIDLHHVYDVHGSCLNA